MAGIPIPRKERKPDLPTPATQRKGVDVRSLEKEHKPQKDLDDKVSHRDDVPSDEINSDELMLDLGTNIIPSMTKNPLISLKQKSVDQQYNENRSIIERLKNMYTKR